MEGNINFTGNLSGSIDTGGGSGTSNYNDLSNKPKINNVTLTGNKTNQQLGIPTGTYNELTGKPSINDVELTGNRTTADLGLFSGDYNDLTNKPTIFDGDYIDLAEKPTINNVELIGNRTTEDLGLFSGAYSDLTGKPALKTVATTGSYDDLINKPTIPAAQVNSDWNAASGVAQILNKPSLATVATSGDYDDLTNKPTIPAAQVNSDWNAASGVAQILNKPSLATVATSGDYDDLTNKPTIPSTAAQIGYDNTTSGLTATDTQDAIDEVNASLTQSLGKGNHSIHCFPTGYITTGGTLLSLFIPLAIKAEVTSISLVSLTGWSLRIPTGGYLTFATPDTTYIDLVSGGIRLTCIKNNGWGVTNNIIVGGDIDSSNLTFNLS